MSTSKISRIGLGQSPGDQRTGRAPDLRLLIDSAPALIHTSLPDGYLDFFNETWLKYVGRSLQDLLGWRWIEYIHPEDVEGIVQKWRASLASGEPFLHETRVRRADGEYRWMLHHKVAVRDEHGNIVKWHGSSIDIEDRKRAEKALQQSQFYLAEGQRLAHMGSWAFNSAGFEYWSSELFRIYGLDPNGKPPTVEEYLALVHPEDRAFMKQGIMTMLVDRRAFDFTKRIVRPDGQIRSVRCVGVPVTQGGTFQGFLGTGMDVTEQEQLTQELRRREAYLAEAQRLSHTGSFGWKPDSGEIVWSDETYRIFEYDPSVKLTIDSVARRVHPEERAEFQKVIDRASAGATHFEHAYRLLLPDGRIKHVHALAHAALDASGKREFVGAGIDVTSIKRAEEELRRSEAYLAEAQRLSKTGSWAWSPDQDIRYWSEECYRVLSFDPQDGLPRFEDFFQRIHPGDQPGFRELIQTAIRERAEWEADYRIVHLDGTVRDIHVVGHPVLSTSGDLVEFVGTVIDVTERKRAEEELREREAELRQALDLTPQMVVVFGPARNACMPTVSRSTTWALVSSSGGSILAVSSIILMTGNGCSVILIVLTLLALLSRWRCGRGKRMGVIAGFWFVTTHCATTRDRSCGGMLPRPTLKSISRLKRDSETRISRYARRSATHHCSRRSLVLPGPCERYYPGLPKSLRLPPPCSSLARRER